MDHYWRFKGVAKIANNPYNVNGKLEMMKEKAKRKVSFASKNDQH